MKEPNRPPTALDGLPGVPEDAIMAITSNEPTAEDPLHVRHLKRIAAKSVHESLKSRHSTYSKDSRKTNKSQSIQDSMKSKNSEESIGSSAPSISSRTTHSMRSGGSSRSTSLDKQPPWFFRDTTFVYLTNMSVAGFGVFWINQALFIEELMQHTGTSLVTMGYLFACVRVGKIVGHLVTVPLTTLLPDKIVYFIVTGLFIFSGLIALVPFITNPYLLGANFFIMGMIYGLADSCCVLIIQMLETSAQKSYFTNTAYAMYSSFCFIASIFIKPIKTHFTDIKTRLLWANVINSGVSLTVALLILTMNSLREKHKYYMVNEAVVGRLPAKFKGFRHYLLSFALLSWAAFSVVFCLSAFWNFLLLFLQNTAANLTSDQVFFVVQLFHGSVMVIRVLSAAIVLIYQNKTVVVVACCGILICAALSSVLLQDRLYQGLIVVLLFYGIGLGWFHQSLLNWLQEHIVITPKTSLPFFLASTSGVVVAPMTVPHIIADASGKVIPLRFIWLTFGLTLSSTLATFILMSIEKLKEDLVQDIELIPSVIRLSRNSYAVSTATTRDHVSQVRDSPGGEENASERGSWRRSRLSKLSTYTQRLDPTLSFVSSIN